MCLGHQAIAAAFGGEVTYAEQLMHGKTSFLTDTEDSILFRGIERPIQVARYHSLAVRESFLPEELRVTARTGQRGSDGAGTQRISHLGRTVPSGIGNDAGRLPYDPEPAGGRKGQSGRKKETGRGTVVTE